MPTSSSHHALCIWLISLPILSITPPSSIPFFLLYLIYSFLAIKTWTAPEKTSVASSKTALAWKHQINIHDQHPQNGAASARFQGRKPRRIIKYNKWDWQNLDYICLHVIFAIASDMNLCAGCRPPLRRPLQLQLPFLLQHHDVLLRDRAEGRLPLHRRRRRPRPVLPVPPPLLWRPGFLLERWPLQHGGRLWGSAAGDELEDELHSAGGGMGGAKMIREEWDSKVRINGAGEGGGQEKGWGFVIRAWMASSSGEVVRFLVSTTHARLYKKRKKKIPILCFCIKYEFLRNLSFIVKLGRWWDAMTWASRLQTATAIDTPPHVWED